MKININSFTNGIVSPYISTRNDLDKYSLSCEELKNFINLPYGAIERRDGTMFVDDITEFSTDNTSVLNPVIGRFKFSNSEVYILVFGDKRIYIRDANDEVSILDTTLKVSTVIYDGTANSIPYTIADLQKIKYRQSADVLYIVHPDYPPHKLIRTGSATAGFQFSCAEVEFTDIAQEDYSNNPLIPMTATRASGTGTVSAGTTVTLTSDSGDNIFTNSQAGDYVKFVAKRSDIPATVKFTASPGNDNVYNYVKGKWDIETIHTWTGTLDVYMNNNPAATAGDAGWQKIFTMDSSADKNYIKNYESIDYQSVRFVSTAATHAIAVNFNATSNVYSTLKILSIVDNDTVTAKTLNLLYMPVGAATISTDMWAHGEWSSSKGYPSCIEFHQERLYMASTYEKPNTIWGSGVSDFQNFNALGNDGLTDSSPVSYSLSGGDVVSIKWMASQRILLVGSDGGNFTVTGAGTNEPITPSSISVRRQDNVSSGSFDAFVASDTVIYSQSNGKKIRAAIYEDVSDGYISEDLNLINNDILGVGIVSMAFQQIPEPYIWIISKDGNMYGMCYNRAQSIFGWSKQVTAGQFLSVTTTTTDDNDIVWLLVKRGSKADPKILLEKMYKVDSKELADRINLDSAITVRPGIIPIATLRSI